MNLIETDMNEELGANLQNSTMSKEVRPSPCE